MFDQGPNLETYDEWIPARALSQAHFDLIQAQAHRSKVAEAQLNLFPKWEIYQAVLDLSNGLKADVSLMETAILLEEQVISLLVAMEEAKRLRDTLDTKHKAMLENQKAIKKRIRQFTALAEDAHDENDHEAHANHLTQAKKETKNLTQLQSEFHKELGAAVLLAANHCPEMLNATWWENESKRTGHPSPAWAKTLCTYFATNGLQRLDLSFDSFENAKLISNEGHRHPIYKAQLHGSNQFCCLKEFSVKDGAYDQVCLSS